MVMKRKSEKVFERRSMKELSSVKIYVSIPNILRYWLPKLNYLITVITSKVTCTGKVHE